MTHHDNTDWDNMEWDEEKGEFVLAISDKNTPAHIPETKDSNGNVLQNGDTVILTRDLDVKGVALSLKRGEKLKNIKVGEDPELIECKIGKKELFIKTCFVKK